jgi:hypothetical protein
VLPVPPAPRQRFFSFPVCPPPTRATAP